MIPPLVAIRLNADGTIASLYVQPGVLVNIVQLPANRGRMFESTMPYSTEWAPAPGHSFAELLNFPINKPAKPVCPADG